MPIFCVAFVALLYSTLGDARRKQFQTKALPFYLSSRFFNMNGRKTNPKPLNRTNNIIRLWHNITGKEIARFRQQRYRFLCYKLSFHFPSQGALISRENRRLKYPINVTIIGKSRNCTPVQKFWMPSFMSCVLSSQIYVEGIVFPVLVDQLCCRFAPTLVDTPEQQFHNH